MKRCNYRRIAPSTWIRMLLLLLLPLHGMPGQSGHELERRWDELALASRPWALWHWVESAVSLEGITADLEAMQAIGLGGAYLMTIRGAAQPPVWDPPVGALTAEWWVAVRHAFAEAERLGLALGMHIGDGFAVAGGPWVTPENSMQQLVWTRQQLTTGRRIKVQLEEPERVADWYRDVAVFAIADLPAAGVDSRTVLPRVRTSFSNDDFGFLAHGAGDERLRYDGSEPMWIEYAFTEPFTLRSLELNPDGRDFQSRRLHITASDDGEHFRPVYRMQSPRHGWQDYEQNLTYAIPETTARYFRLVYDPTGAEPGAEDLDTAKWRTRLRLRALIFSAEPRIDQFEGKNGGIWRISPYTTEQQVPDRLAVDRAAVFDVSAQLDRRGRLRWQPPYAATWTLLRIGHTSTGHTNATGGAAVGLEIDKMNPQAARLQYQRWFGEALRQAGPARPGRALQSLFIDSWECGSQNWTPAMRESFQRLRGYDPLPWLPAATGMVIDSAEASERFLHDLRRTIAELIEQNFWQVIAGLARADGCSFAAEATAPVTIGDGLRHFDKVDLPMGEFWLRSPTHDKPNDILDAVSGARIYGKPIVAAEAFTQLRILWDEHPALFKPLADRHFALGINQLIHHVFTHNPWVDRKPGMTLGGVGLFFQRDQTWWRPGRAWVEYATRVQTLLQTGVPVTDIAVFTGEDLPSRAVLPDRMAAALHGLVGRAAYVRNQARMANHGLPLREAPAGVLSSANTTDSADWVDALRGYQYDSINADALLRLAQVKDGRIELPGGASYALLVLPASRRMAPEGQRMSVAMACRIGELAAAGATILVHERPLRGFGPQDDSQLQRLVDNWWPELNEVQRRVGRGMVIRGPWNDDDLSAIGVQRDWVARELDGTPAALPWTHRRAAEQNLDVYFVSNPLDRQRALEISLRVVGRVPEIWDPVSGRRAEASVWRIEDGRTRVRLELPPHGSALLLLRQPTDSAATAALQSAPPKGGAFASLLAVNDPWQLRFDPAYGGPVEQLTLTHLTDWTQHTDPAVRAYSGTAVYRNRFYWHAEARNGKPVWLDLGSLEAMAEVFVNDIACGVAWTPPYRVDIGHALRNGSNTLRIEVSNTWHNRLLADHALPVADRITFARAPFRLGGREPIPAGLLGPLSIVVDP